MLVISQLFYNNVLFAVFMSPWLYFFVKEQAHMAKQKENLRFANEFKDAITAVSFALNAGYSVENSFKEALEELVVLYGKNSRIVREFSEISTRIRNNENIETVLNDFADKSDIAEIEYFAEVFGYAKRSGGDIISIIRNTASIIREKIELDNDIKTIISGKKQEQRIMTIMPFVTVAYLRFTSPEFIGVFYANISGRIFMSICLIIVIAADYIAKRIVNIEI